MTGDAPPGVHPSYHQAVAAAPCPVCGARPGADCPRSPDGQWDIHIGRIRLYSAEWPEE
jgi:hypothetical protein